MAEQRKINGKDVLLFIDTNGGEDYNVIVCLTSHNFTHSTSVEDASSKCGPDNGPGTQTQSIDLEGQVIYSAGSEKATSYDILRAWQTSKEIGWKSSTVSPEAGDEVSEGKGWVSDFGDTYDQTGRATFTATIQIVGNRLIGVYPESPQEPNESPES